MAPYRPIKRDIPKLSGFLGVFGVLEIIGGLTMCVQLWPGEPSEGYKWMFSAYVPALTWLGVGITSATLLFVAAAIVAYSAQIRTTSEDLLACFFRVEALQDKIARTTSSDGNKE